MGKTRDLFKKIRDTKGIFHAKMSTIKDRKCMDLTEAEVDIFLELPCFFNDPTDPGSSIFGSAAFCKSILNIWKFTTHTLLKPGLENFEHYFAIM